jgi:phosphatidate cytidylyltransferase
MLKRIIVGLLLLPLVPLVLFIAPDWVMAACISAVSALAVWELLNATGFSPKKRLTAYAAVFAAGVPMWVYIRPSLIIYTADAILSAGAAVFVLLLFTEAVVNYEKVKFSQISIILTGALVVPLFFSSLIRITAMPWGRYYIILPFIAAFLCDTFAYFTGVKWGKRKLTPVSPKKTAEGAGGGLFGAMLGMTAYWALMKFALSVSYSLPLLLLCGLLGGLAGILGDLSMSLVKREAGIKDFGTLLPGHGGVLDRFDSLLFAAPVIEILIRVLPAL